MISVKATDFWPEIFLSSFYNRSWNGFTMRLLIRHPGG